MAWKNPRTHELRIFGYEIYPITSYLKKLDDRTQEGSFMGYTNIRATIKYLDPTPINSNTFHLIFLINMTINLLKDGRRDLKLWQTQIFLPSQH